MKSLALMASVLLFVGAAMAKDVTTQIKVTGMTCEACAVSVQRSLEKTKGEATSSEVIDID